MERRRLSLRVLLATFELAGYLALPASVMALARGHTDLAIAASFGAVIASTLRAVSVGAAIESELRRGWRALVDAARRRSVTGLRARAEGEESVTMLIDAVREAAVFDAVTVPHVVAVLLALAAVAVAVVVLLGVQWLALGTVALGVAAAFAAYARARLRPLQEQAWRDLGVLVLECRVLLDGSAELRAHGCESSFSRALLQRADAVSRAERAASTWSAVVSLVPAAAAVLTLAAPARAGVRWVAEALASDRIADAGVLGGAALLLGVNLVHHVQTSARAAPYRAALRAFLAAAVAPASRDHGKRPDDLARASIAFEGVSYVYPGSAVATPLRAEVVWAPGRGLAITGENGAGKSTLALLLLGLLEPLEGSIRIAGVDVAELDLEQARVAYVPQAAFVAHGASVAWHMRLFAGADDEAVDHALERVGLTEVLAEHARRAGVAPREVPAGELSGGERQRMHLARALLQKADLLILDEPEAGLDERWRRELRELVDQLSRDCRVLLIAHDESIIPASFQRLSCQRGSLS